MSLSLDSHEGQNDLIHNFIVVKHVEVQSLESFEHLVLIIGIQLFRICYGDEGRFLVQCLSEIEGVLKPHLEFAR